MRIEVIVQGNTVFLNETFNGVLTRLAYLQYAQKILKEGLPPDVELVDANSTEFGDGLLTLHEFMDEQGKAEAKKIKEVRFTYYDKNGEEKTEIVTPNNIDELVKDAQSSHTVCGNFEETRLTPEIEK